MNQKNTMYHSSESIVGWVLLIWGALSEVLKGVLIVFMGVLEVSFMSGIKTIWKKPFISQSKIILKL